MTNVSKRRVLNSFKNEKCKRFFVFKCIKTTPRNFCMYFEGKISKGKYPTYYKERQNPPETSEIENAHIFFVKNGSIRDYISNFFENNQDDVDYFFEYFEPVEVFIHTGDNQ